MADGLDILVAAPAVAARLNECLAALEREISMLDDAAALVTLTVAHAGNPPVDAAERFPHARWLSCEARASLPELYGKALAETSGEWLAFLDADCAVEEGWLQAALRLCRRPENIFGGAVEPARLQSGVAWAAYFCDYGAFLPPLPPGAAQTAPGNNLLLRRSTLAQAPALAAPQFWKTLFLKALATLGDESVNAPHLVIRYEKNMPAHVWLRRRFENGRCFAAMRTAGSARPMRLARTVGAPLVPPILLMRLVRDAWPRARYRAELGSALPWIMAGLAAWAAGECAGLILGKGSACERVF